MNAGEYVRTKSYGIKKVNGFSSTLEEDFIDCDYDKYQRVLINKKDIIKSSPNIIDLIEVGDYVNGYKVYAIENDYELSMGKVKTLYIEGFGRILNEDIKSIVTKEQFEQMEYKIQ